MAGVMAHSRWFNATHVSINGGLFPAEGYAPKGE